MTEKCLFAIAANTGDDPDYGLVIVDNGSTDWTMYLLHAMEGDIQVLNNDRNEGFARACNRGGQAGTGDYVLFLNNDTVPRSGWLKALVDLADEDPGIGIVGAKLLYPDTGTVQHAGIAIQDGVPEHVYRGGGGDDPLVAQVRDCDMVTGACLLIRRTLFEQLGGFDTGFVNGVEDIDLCLRARALGHRVVYCPDSVVEHHEGVSEGRFDNVAANLVLFRQRWGDRFDAQGRFIASATDTATSPEGDPAAAAARAADAALKIADAQSADAQLADAGLPATLTGNWEGSFLLHSSLAYVNRELVLALLASEECDLGLQSYEPDEFGVEEDARFWPLAQRMDRPYAKAEFHVKHRWPPDFTRPHGDGRFILMQPWEFGRIPASWLEPLRRNVDEVWAYTSHVKQCYVDSGIDPAMIRVVPLGVDPALFRPEAEPLALETDKRFKFLFVGGTLYRKGIDLLLKAYYEAFDPAEDVCLVIKDMGANSFYRNQNAREGIEQLQADPNCAEILYRSDSLRGIDIPGLYTAADALVHPYRGEGFGLPVAEAMACGLPVVVTSGGATDDFCPHDLVYGIPAHRKAIHFEEQTAGEAWLLEPEFEALKRTMRQVFENATEAAARGARASEHIRSRFTWELSGAAALEALSTPTAGGNASRSTQVLTLASPASEAAAGPGKGDGKQLFPDFSGRGVEPAALGYLQADPGRGGESAGEPASPEVGNQPVASASQRAGTASVFLKIGDSGGSDHARLTHLAGPVDAFEVVVSPQYPLGSQLELIRTSAANREYMAIIGPEAPPAAAIGRLAAALGANPRMGLIGAGARPAASDSPFAYPDSSQVLLVRMEALAAVGGFDEAFTGAAVIANAARCLRTQGWEVELGPQGQPVDGDSEWRAVCFLEAGDRLRREGQIPEALSAYRSAAEAKPDYVEALLVLTDCLLDDGDSTAAVDAIERLVDLDPESAWAHNYAGLVYFKSGDADTARARLRRALDLQPDLVEARVNLGVLEWECDDFEAALRELGEASRVDSTNRDLVCNISLIHTQIGQWEAAVTVLEDYLSRRPDDVEVLHQLADIQVEHGSAAQARQVAQAILRIDPENASATKIIERCSGREEEDEEEKRLPPNA